MEDNKGGITEQNVDVNEQNKGTQDNGAAGADKGNGGNGGLSEFDKFLQGEGMQAEFDRRVAKALETQKTKLGATTKTQIDEAVAEALRVAKMSTEERAQHEAQQRADALAKREAAILRRELQAQAKETLISKGLPVSLADTINYADEDSVNKSIEALEKSFQAAVQAGVEAKMKGTKTLTKADASPNTALEDIIANAMKNGLTGF